MSLLLLVWSCDEKVSGTEPPAAAEGSSAWKTMEQLWKTSPLDDDLTERRKIFAEIQRYADACPAPTFSSFMSADDALAASLAKYDDALTCYNAAFERVLAGVKNDRPSEGEVHIWMLYNMGYVVKISSGCFAIDVYHRRAAELEPYIDFYAITHVHNDHKSQGLIDAMTVSGKPVVQNFLDKSGNGKYTSTEAADYKIGDFSLHTFITNHNNDAAKNVPVTVFQIDCGEASGNFVLLHSGDSNFRPEQFSVTSDIDVYIPRYAPNALTENNVIGKTFTPDYVLLSHILELSHADAESSRWTLEQGLSRAAALDCDHTYMPFWGEKIVWKDSGLN